MKKNKLLLTILGVLFVAILITSGTFALWSWVSNNTSSTNVSLTTEKGFSCSVDGGGNITNNEVQLVPTSCTDSQYAIKRTITTNVVNDRNTTIYMDLWLDIKKLSQGLSDSQNFRYALTTSGTSCTEGTIISHGTFNGKAVDDKIDLILYDKYLTTGTKTYYLYIWLDYDGIDRTSQNEEFDLELGGKCNDFPGPNKPYINGSGLIPVKLSDDGSTVTAISEDNPDWYDYSSKKWANAVLATSTNRSNYQNLTGNTEVNIPTSEILAYYVWIPRYSYKVWQYTGVSNAGSGQEIEIEFVLPTTKEAATGNGQWYTHPAFTFGDTELSGIWVGKFEISYSTNTTVNISCTNENCTNSNNLRILPGKTPLRNNSISSFFYAGRSMVQDNNSFGLDSAKVNSHISKNSEWGAIAYLSHSIYGINEEISINNTQYTGRGSNSSSYGAGTNYLQSTNGNVTGVFDMAGGYYEYVMGDYKKMNTAFSNINTVLAKYYNNYNYSFGSCSFNECGGHALGETAGWYNEGTAYLINSSNWYLRGGLFSENTAGIFAFSVYPGYAWGSASSRLILVEE